MASASVVEGSVLGISKTAVTPPSTAARLPLSRSSFHSRPGSRKCTWLSMTPGRTVRPAAAKVSPAEACARSPIAAILPPRTPMSAGPRPAWFATSPSRTIRSKVSATGALPRGGVRQQRLGCAGHRLDAQVHHVTERLRALGVNRLDLLDAARAARHAGVVAPGAVEPLVGRPEQAKGRTAGRRGEVHGPGVVADEQPRPPQAGERSQQID